MKVSGLPIIKITLHVWYGDSVGNGSSVSHGYWRHLVASQRKRVLTVREWHAAAHSRLLNTSREQGLKLLEIFFLPDPWPFAVEEE